MPLCAYLNAYSADIYTPLRISILHNISCVKNISNCLIYSRLYFCPLPALAAAILFSYGINTRIHAYICRWGANMPLFRILRPILAHFSLWWYNYTFKGLKGRKRGFKIDFTRELGPKSKKSALFAPNFPFMPF